MAFVFVCEERREIRGVVLLLPVLESGLARGCHPRGSTLSVPPITQRSRQVLHRRRRVRQRVLRDVDVRLVLDNASRGAHSLIIPFRFRFGCSDGSLIWVVAVIAKPQLELAFF